jgi:ssRNA-specific RNase YbeY (16S rRNA maturation enzyme)
MGKTPRALAMLQMRESARDNWDRFMMERALEQVIDRFVDLITKKQEKPIKVYLSEQDLKAIAEINPDVVEMFESGKYGQLIVKSDETKNVNCRFFIDAGSTYKKDEMLENETLTQILSLIFKIPGAMEQIMKNGKVVLGDVSINFGELFKRWIISSGVQDWDKIVEGAENQQGDEVNFENPELKNVIANAPDDIKNLLMQIGYGQQQQAENPIGQPNTAISSGIQEGSGGEIGL